MGVPMFYAHLTDKYDNIILSEFISCDRLFLDFNAIIHTTSQIVVVDNPKLPYDKLEKLIFERVVEHTLYLTTISKPSLLLYIAVDGIAPLAKQSQQRKRRYLSAFRNEVINNFKKKNKIPFVRFDSNCISPGTEFMIRLDAYLKDYFATHEFDFKVVVSGHDEPGEGEQKLTNFIKSTTLGPEKDIIYGLDADLIMLSLSISKKNIYLMRESSHFADRKTKDHDSNVYFDFKYLDIDELGKCISKYLYDSSHTSFMYDYITICMLAGNDFIPGLSFLKIKSGAVDILCDVYKQVRRDTNENLITKNAEGIYSVNLHFFTKFVEILAEIEDYRMKVVTKEFYESEYNFHRKFDSKLNKFISEFENNPVINKYPLVIDPIRDDQWKSSYYIELFHSNENETIKKVCINYLEGIIWNVNYYFNRAIRTSFSYKYNYSPCAFDLVKYLTTMDGREFTKMHESLNHDHEGDVPCTQDLQLLLVLPPSSSHLVAPHLRSIFHDISYNCLHFYPTKFAISKYLKRVYHECVPILPKIDVTRVESALRSCD